MRAADRLDPRVDHKADDYAPQVAGTVDQQPTPASEANREPEAAPPADARGGRDDPGHRGRDRRRDRAAGSRPSGAPAEEQAEEQTTESAPAAGTPLLPRRTPGSHDMPGKPMESEGGGGWFTRKDS